MQPWPPYLDPLPYPPELCVMLVYSLLDAGWRGKGIGRELNQRRMAAVREQGFRYVFATVHPEHQVNMDIQLSMGFEVIAQKKIFSHQLMRNLLFMAL